ncbi:hypothetical protein [Fangia hongkongensis]|uniref:hypothetical protein n=1 Tax=Fangia hongkongensis TaxID=270495 RepID=UPI00037F2EC3|nr:hypothetical protein [Fangia hongkongensis]MBK2125287.1 hypothetical protein [Fangia hongkongensis]
MTTTPTIAPVKSIFNSQDIKQELSTKGLDGLQFDHSSFPVITLKSAFEMSDAPDFEHRYFDITVMQTLEKHILVDANDQNYDGIKYSRDGVTTTDGEPLQVFIDSMLSDGRQPVTKRYLDILVQLHTEDKHNGKLAVLSISPTSVSRVSGFFYQLKLQNQLDNLPALKIRVSRGQQRTSKGGQTYYLWALEVVQDAALKVA